MGSEQIGYMDIDLYTTHNHHISLQNKWCSHTSTSPIGDFDSFGWETECIPPFGDDWYMAWHIHLVGKD